MKTPEDIVNRFIKEEGVKFDQERDDWVLEAMIEYVQEQVKNCSIPLVSQQRELLNDFVKFARKYKNYDIPYSLVDEAMNVII